MDPSLEDLFGFCGFSGIVGAGGADVHALKLGILSQATKYELTPCAPNAHTPLPPLVAQLQKILFALHILATEHAIGLPFSFVRRAALQEVGSGCICAPIHSQSGLAGSLIGSRRCHAHPNY